MKYKLNVNENIENNYMEKLLKYRGVSDIDKFLSPDIFCLNSPELLDNIQEGYELLFKNIDKKILFVVDCDVDGFTSSAILWQYIKILNPEADLSFRVHEGKQHGLEDIMEHIEEHQEIDLIIIPDAGSNDEEYFYTLKDFGIDTLVLDHHIVENESKKAIIINNQLSENYPNKELTGAGVVYQFCRYIDMMNGTDYANYFIDLAALGIISDMGSMIELENRYICCNGLNSIHNELFAEFVEKQSYSIGGQLTPIGVAFYITPLINALIRVGELEDKIKLFESFIDCNRIVSSTKRGEKGMTEKLKTQMVRTCVNARSKQNRIKEKAVEELEIKIFNNNLLDNKILFIELVNEDYPPELNGLIAMQLAAKYKRPTILARLGLESYVKGSIRGLNDSNFNDFKGYLETTNLFDYVLGHPNAAGCCIKENDIPKLLEKANIDLMEYDFNEDFYEVDFVRNCNSGDIDKIIFDINRFKGTYGQHNNEPLIAVKEINLTPKDIKIMGANGDTVKFEKFGVTYIKFHAKKLIEDLQNFEECKVELIGKANVNQWAGKVIPQLFIESYEIKNGTLEF